MRNIKINYLVPDADFASEKGQGGQVTHAKGILEGLVENGIDVKLYGEPNFVRFIDSKNLEVIESDISFMGDVLYAYKMLKTAIHEDVDYYLIRKSLGVLILSIVTLNFRILGIKGKVVWELNGLSLHNYRHSTIGKVFYQLSVLIHKIGLRSNVGVYAVTNYLKEELSAGVLSMNKKNITVIPNGGPEWMGVKSSTKVVRFIYLGVFQAYNDFNTIIDAFNKLKEEISDRKIELHFCGYGKQEELIIRYSSQHDDIYYWGPKNINQLYQESIANERSIGLIPMSDDNSKLRSPIKMYDYLALGMPILGTDKISHNISNENKLLFKFYSNKNIKSCKNKMKVFLNDDYDWEKVKKLAKEESNLNSWTTRMKKLLLFIQDS